MKDRSAEYLSARRVRDQSMILLLLGTVLLVSPVAGIFQLDAKLAGVPVTLIYLLVVWAGLILGAAILSRQLRRIEHQDTRRGAEPPQ